MRPFFRMLAVAVVIVMLLPVITIRPAAAQGSIYKGHWSIEKDSRDQPSLQYVQDGKIVFFIGLGRAIGLWIAYPGPRRPEGKATITIRTSSRTWTMKGALTNDDDSLDYTNKHATYFLQWDMGLSRPKPEFDRLTSIYNQFIDSLLTSKQIIVVTAAGSITLPRVDVKEAREQMRI